MMREAMRVVVGGKQGCTARREMPVRAPGALAAGEAARRGAALRHASRLRRSPWPCSAAVRASRPSRGCLAVRCGCAACLPPQPEVRPSQQGRALLRTAHKNGLAAGPVVLSLVSSSCSRGQAHAPHGAHTAGRDAPSGRVTGACSWAGQPPERAAAGTPRRTSRVLDRPASSSARDKVVCCVALLSRRRWQSEGARSGTVAAA